LLPYAVRELGGGISDSKIALEILNNLVTAAPSEEIDSGGEVFVDSEKRQANPAYFAFRPPPLFPDDPFGGLREMSNPDEANERRQVTINTAVERIKEARKNGASLFLHSFDPTDLSALISNHREVVDQWITDLEGQSEFNRHRMYRAEGFYLALCEELFKTDALAAAKLWRQLKSAMRTRFTGEGQIDEMLHILFANLDKAEAGELLEELYELPISNTGSDLFALALAAQLNGQEDWLKRKIATDYQSSRLWRRQRAQILDGLQANNKLPIEVDEGPADLPTNRRREVLEWQRKEARAHHWWDAFWDAGTVEKAYAAWTLFKAAADRRAYCWMKDRIRTAETGGELDRKKLAHFRLNFDQLKKAMQKHEKEMSKEFLGIKISDDVGPWRRSYD
jgi:hypothetical protein